MKRLFALLMLTLLSFAAFAQENVCNVPPPVKWVYYTDLSVVGGPYQCMPAPGGPGVGLTVRTNTAGVMTYWYCKGADGKYTANFGAATWARLMTNELKPDTAMSDPSLTAIWCPFQAEMNANVPAAATDPVWKVATNGGTATRPTYAFANGVRAKTVYSTDPRIAVGSVCDIRVSVVEGSVTYAQVLPGRVSVCVKQ